jgi:hypothetical protein
MADCLSFFDASYHRRPPFSHTLSGNELKNVYEVTLSGYVVFFMSSQRGVSANHAVPVEKCIEPNVHAPPPKNIPGCPNYNIKASESLLYD